MAMAPSWETLLFVALGAVTFIIFVISVLYCCRRFLFSKNYGSSSTTTVSTTSSTNKNKIKKRLNLNGTVIMNK